MSAAPFPAFRLPAEARGRRARIEDAIEILIAELDRMDGDPDLEPSLAGGYAPFEGHPCDAEAEHEHDEPSLGAPEDHPSQIVWLRGVDDDREADGLGAR